MRRAGSRRRSSSPGCRPRRTGWSASSRMATSAPPRSPWRWRCGRASCCSTSRPPAWATRRPTRSPSSSAACTRDGNLHHRADRARHARRLSPRRPHHRARPGRARSPRARRRRSPPTRRCRPPIWARPHERRAHGRGPAHLLRQEPHPARREPRGRRGQDHRAPRPQRRRQDDDAAQPHGADAAARGPRHDLRQRHDALADLPHRRARRRLRAGGAADLRQSQRRGESARCRSSGPARGRSRVSTSSFRASPSASPTAAASSRAASRRCCRSAARCCSTRGCSSSTSRRKGWRR